MELVSSYSRTVLFRPAHPRGWFDDCAPAQEVELTGAWTFDGTVMHRDRVCDRIEELTSQVLKRMAISKL